jgi:hypothetical protein
MTNVKTCTCCREAKDLSEFHKSKAASDGLNYVCKSCKSQKAKGAYQKWSPEQKEKHKVRRMKYLYGLSEEEYAYLQSQNACGICGAASSSRGNLCVDHDHATGKVRGVLCTECNLALGYLKDNVALLQSAIDYLKKGI